MAFGSDRIEHIGRIVSWSRPLEGIVALNVDVSVSSSIQT